jgi:hypothetical protein
MSIARHVKIFMRTPGISGRVAFGVPLNALVMKHFDKEMPRIMKYG